MSNSFLDTSVFSKNALNDYDNEKYEVSQVEYKSGYPILGGYINKNTNKNTTIYVGGKKIEGTDKLSHLYIPNGLVVRPHPSYSHSIYSNHSIEPNEVIKDNDFDKLCENITHPTKYSKNKTLKNNMKSSS